MQVLDRRVPQNASRALEIVAQLLFAEVEGVHAIIRQATEEIRLRHAGKLVGGSGMTTGPFHTS